MIGVRNSSRLAIVAMVSATLALMGSALASPSPEFRRINQGGPDAYGYQFIDNINESAGPSYSALWQDIAGSGTGLTDVNGGTLNGSEEFSTIAPGMMIRFYGQNWGAPPSGSSETVVSANIGVSTNGFIRLLGATQTMTAGPAVNEILPTTNTTMTPGGLIAPFWDDLNGNGANDTAQWQVVGTAPNRRLIIQWTNWGYVGGGGATDMTVQVQITESTGTADSEIIFIYDGVTDAREGGNSATIGIQASGGGSALQYSFDTANSTAADTSTNPATPRVIRFFAIAFTLNLSDPSGLGQFAPDGTTAISTGASLVDATTVVFNATLDNSSAVNRRLQVEARLTSQAFTGAATHFGSNTTGSLLSLTAANLTPGDYHWRARVIEPVAGYVSNWIAFGGNDNGSDPTDPNGATDFNAPPGVGGPDAFGYRYIDSTNSSGPVYSTEFEDISASGTQVTWTAYSGFAFDDEGEAQVNIGFTFPYYGNTYTDCWLNTNGFLKFGASTVPGNTAYSPVTMPTAGGDDNKICVKWRDWFTSTARYTTLGSAPNRVFVVLWSDGTEILELKLYENGDILMLFQNINGTGGATGIENAIGSVGLLYALNGAPVTLVNSRAIRFRPPPPAPPPDPTALGQFLADGATAISTGGVTTQTSVVLRVTTDNPNSASRRLQVEVRPTSEAFTGSPTQSGTASTGSTLSVNVTNVTTGLYHWRARVQDTAFSTNSAWVAFGGNDSGTDPTDANGATDFERQTPPVTPPPDPTALGQFLADGTTAVATGASTFDTTFVFSVATDNPNGVNRRIQVEVVPTSDPFTGAFTEEGADSTGGTLSVTVANLDIGLYHWRARVYEAGTGLASNWVAFGGNDNANDATDPNGAADFAIQIAPPPDPTGLLQYRADGITALGTGAGTSDTTLVFSAATNNPTAANRRLQVEVRPTSQAFTGTFTQEGTDTTAGTVTLSVTNLSAGLYHWRARVFESGTGLASNWVAFGGNDVGTDLNGATDFEVLAPVPDPTNLAQFQANGATPIFTGSFTDDTSIVLTASTNNPTGANRRLQVEARPISQGFTGNFTHAGVNSTGSALSINIASIAVGFYHWRARVIEPSTGLVSNWVSFGNNDSGTDPTDVNGQVDFEVRAPLFVPPPAPTSLTQFPLTVGGVTTDTTLVLRGVTFNPNGVDRRLQVEVRNTSQGFTGFFTHEGSNSTAGLLEAGVSNLTPGTYHWRARVIEPVSGMVSPWTSFGGNDSTTDSTDANGAADFVVQAASPPGGGSGSFSSDSSSDSSRCGQGVSADGRNLARLALGLALLIVLATTGRTFRR